MPIPLLCSTRNAHKVGEIRSILGAGFEVFDLSVIPGLGEVEETGITFEENATLKAMAAARSFQGYVIADDSGLEVDALGGAPGVRSARFAGDHATDADNRALLREKLLALPHGPFTARFRCVIALVKGTQLLGSFHGAVEGRLITDPLGDQGFGYDPHFIPDGHVETFAQLPAATKNLLSHRACALRSLQAWPGFASLD